MIYIMLSIVVSLLKIGLLLMAAAVVYGSFPKERRPITGNVETARSSDTQTISTPRINRGDSSLLPLPRHPAALTSL
jgi:hypothetical protein